MLLAVAILDRRFHLFVLLTASLVFYGWWNWHYLFLLFATTLIDFAITNALHRIDDPGYRRILVWASVITNLGVLAYFKYANFFLHSLSDAAQAFGLSLPLWSVNVLLPAGISFYTFQNLSYVIDVYYRRLPVEKNVFQYCLFISFFPHLVAGPIMRAGVLMPQLRRQVVLTPENWAVGLKTLLVGALVKIVLADNLAGFVDAVYSNVAASTGPQLLLATIFFGFQIYGDFLGYSLMAIGSARLLGVHLITNFDMPYLSLSLTEFWRRWHISLSTWFRDYVYVPLGGSREGGVLRKISLLIGVFLLSGLWHGANWTFVIWGAGHGSLVALEKLLQDRLPRFPVVIKRAYVFLTAMSLWVFFRSPDLGTALEVFRKIFTDFSLAGISSNMGRLEFMMVGSFCLLWLPTEYLLRHHESFLHRLWADNVYVRQLAYQGGIFLLWFVGNWGEIPFIYFQF